MRKPAMRGNGAKRRTLWLMGGTLALSVACAEKQHVAEQIAAEPPPVVPAASPAGRHRGLHRRFLGACCLASRRSGRGLSQAALPRRRAARSVSRARWIPSASFRGPAGHGGFTGRSRSHRRAAGLSALAREARAARRSPERRPSPAKPGPPAAALSGARLASTEASHPECPSHAHSRQRVAVVVRRARWR
jgi:hypothetical protein